MKKLIVLLSIFFFACNGTTDQAEPEKPIAPTAFAATLAISNSAPGRGAEKWNGQWAVTTIDPSLDNYKRFSLTEILDYNTGAIYFTNFDTWIKASIDAGIKFNFGVMAFYPSTGPTVGAGTLSYTKPLHDAMQKESVPDAIDKSNYTSWTPNWNSPTFRKTYNDMAVALHTYCLNTKYKGISYMDAIGYVDIRTYGNTGEWTGATTRYNPGNLPVATIATAQTQINFIEDFRLAWHDKQLVICYAAAVGDQKVDGQPREVGYKVFTSSTDVGRIGLRRDCLGQINSYVSDWCENNTIVYGPPGAKALVFKDEIMNIYKVAPWVGEPCSCCATSNTSQIALTSNGVVYGDLPRQIKFYHIVMFGNGNLASGINQQSKDSIKQASLNAGYQLSFGNSTITGSTLSMNWSNTGVTPVYENWNASIELRKTDGSVIWSIKSNFNPKLFLPGTKTITDQLQNGAGDLYIVIKDPTNYRKPLPLNMNSRTADGSYLIKSGVTIGGSTPIPPDPPVPGCDTVYIHDTIKVTVHDTIPRVCPGVPTPSVKQATILFPDGSTQILK